MVTGILHFISYLIAGAIAVWLFKFVASLIELISIFVFKLLTGFKGGFEDETMYLFPKRFTFTLILQRIIIGTLNAIMIFYVTGMFLENTGANIWLYIILSLIWSLFILSYAAVMPFVYLISSTGTLILFWLSFGAFAYIILIPIVFVVSFAYYSGRADVAKEYENL